MYPELMKPMLYIISIEPGAHFAALRLMMLRVSSKKASAGDQRGYQDDQVRG